MTQYAEKCEVPVGQEPRCFVADSLPAEAACTNVDGFTVVGDNLLILQWKDGQDLSASERALFERITAQCPATVMIIVGDAEAMTVNSLRVARQGQIGPCESADLESVRNAIRKWSAWALANPAVRRHQEVSWN